MGIRIVVFTFAVDELLLLAPCRLGVSAASDRVADDGGRIVNETGAAMTDDEVRDSLRE